MPEIRSTLNEWAARGARREPAIHVRGLAMVCFAIAAIVTLALIFPATPDPDDGRNIRALIPITVAAILLLMRAERFHVWSLHVAISLVVVAVMVRLTIVESAVGTAITLSLLVWFCLLTGAIYRPPVARTYCAAILIGSGLIVAFSEADVPIGLWSVFAISFCFISELLSRLATRLRDEAAGDPLTGLRNRKGLEEDGALAVAIAKRSDKPLAVAQIDLDEFKRVNDHRGHLAGDQVLRQCAESWRGEIRASDVLGRTGGDEFALVMPGSDAESAKALLDRMALASPVTWTVGLAQLESGDDIRSCLARADRDLIRRKAALHSNISTRSDSSSPSASNPGIPA